MDGIRVSVIIPIYGVEKFIARCAESLFCQTLRDVEYIFINDATRDKSIDILKSVVSRHDDIRDRVMLINLCDNKGLPAARNEGLKAASGEYIFHCDSDDYVEPNMLEDLYEMASVQGADIVWCDWFLSLGKREKVMKQPCYHASIDAVKGMLGGAMKFNVWNKLAKRSLYVGNHIDFPAGYGMGEDMTMIMLFANARKVAYLPKAYYHYVKTNAAAFSRTYSSRHLEELKYNVTRIETFIKERYGNELDDYVSFMKLEAKFPFLLSEDKARLKLWKEWYPEANKYIMKNKTISLRSRILQWAAMKDQFWVVRIYSFLLNHVIYGSLYK